MYQAVFVLGSHFVSASLYYCRANTEIDICPYRCDPFYTAISRLKSDDLIIEIKSDVYLKSE